MSKLIQAWNNNKKLMEDLISKTMENYDPLIRGVSLESTN